MKDEEMAKKWVEDNKYGINEYCLSTEDFGEHGFLAGLKAGRPQWHDLQKDENDLPKEEKQYLCCILSWVGGEKVYACLIYDTQYHSWKESYGDVIKWKEIV